MAFEQNLQSGLFSQTRDKTFIDKLLGRRDVEEIRKLIRKPGLKREELLDILYLLTSTESKLLNYSEWDRYVILKYFVWLREFTKIAELLYDYEEHLEVEKIPLNDYTRQMLANNKSLIEHNAKFLIDLYLNISRTSLSVGATGFLEVLKNKFEYDYKNLPGATSTQPQTNNSWGFKRK